MIHEIMAVVVPPGGTPPDAAPAAVIGAAAGLIGLSLLASLYAGKIHGELARLEKALTTPVPGAPGRPGPPDFRGLSPMRTTAVLCVEGFDASGVHALINIARMFPGGVSQILFLAHRPFDMTDSERQDEAQRLRVFLEGSLSRYLPICELLDMQGTVQVVLGPDPIKGVIKACEELLRQCPQAVFFWSRPVISPSKWHHRLLENAVPPRLAEMLFRRGWVTLEMELPVHVGAL